MGQARNRGTYEERKQAAIKAIEEEYAIAERLREDAIRQREMNSRPLIASDGDTVAHRAGAGRVSRAMLVAVALGMAAPIMAEHNHDGFRKERKR